uniref:Uncharacterized protein n=1 Tax=Physcomitrium patens TaxID=3218 RepID=A0A2K1JZY3_PHYPA|nr:hypothetical protein PHYPA_014206 [Physcomitrium patens]
MTLCGLDLNYIRSQAYIVTFKCFCHLFSTEYCKDGLLPWKVYMRHLRGERVLFLLNANACLLIFHGSPSLSLQAALAAKNVYGTQNYV